MLKIVKIDQKNCEKKIRKMLKKLEKIFDQSWKKKEEDRKVKGNSVQEACAKCFAVHILKFEILQVT